MISFNKENKITFEQLSFSLQDKLRKIVLKSEINNALNLLDLYEQCLNGIRFSFVNSLSEITNPINNCEVAILNNNGAMILYMYANNKWIKIPAGDVYYKITIKQSSHQTISVKIGTNTYTSSLNAKYGTNYSVIVEPDQWYTAGTPNVSNAALSDNITISATNARLKTDYVLDGVIGKLTSNDDYGIRLNYNNSTDLSVFYGSLSPQLFDNINIKQRTSNNTTTYTSALNFWGAIAIPTEFKQVTMVMQYNSDTYTILDHCDTADFNSTGDLYNHSLFTTQAFYNLFKSLKGKSVKFYVHFDM